VLLEDNSANESESMSTFRDTVAFKTYNERLREGSSLLTFNQNIIPKSVLDRKKIIIVGATDIHRNLYINKPIYYGSEFLNMSPPFHLPYTDKFDNNKDLFMYLRDVWDN
jgi:hypothetical protein